MKRPPAPILLTSLLLTLSTAAAPPHPDLKGTITTPQGQPLQGATVYVWTAGPKVGTSTYCPSCYADCGRRATSAADGSFTLPSPDPELLFKLLIIREGNAPAFAEKVDPAAGPLAVELKPAPPLPDDARQILTGRVLDPNNKPLPGALVSPSGVHNLQGSGQWGGLETFGVTPMALTNDKGEFRLTANTPLKSMDLQVEAKALAKQNFTEVPTGAKPTDLPLITGASVSVRLLKDAKPLPGVEVGLVQENRTPAAFVGEYTLGTDSDGRALFANLPTNQAYFVYAKWASANRHGATTAKQVLVGPQEVLHNAGDLHIQPGLTITGRVRLSDDRPIPPNTRLLVGRDAAWDTASVELDEKGRFAITGLAPEKKYSLSVRVPGYHLSPKNVSFDPLNYFRLEGDITQDLHDLVILLEPGKPTPTDYEALRQGRLKRPSGPLRGI
jgi:hypothetical protein